MTLIDLTVGYLLDRSNIVDLIQRLYMDFDVGDFSRWEDEILAEHVTIDYTVLWGGKPYVVSGAQFTEQWRTSLQSKAASAQHIVSSVLVDLPQPGSVPAAPNTAKAVLNGSALIKTFKANVVENTGRLHVDVVRVPDSQGRGNPWRISGLRAELVWENGTPLKQIADDYEEWRAGKGKEVDEDAGAASQT